MTDLLSFSAEQLTQAAALKEKIAALQEQLEAILGSTPSVAKPARKKRTMSAAGRARIIAAQKARWAKVKAQKESVPVVREEKTGRKKKGK